jgi:hypothetical protein
VRVLLSDPAIRETVLSRLDSRFDYHLAQAENLRSLFIALNDEVFEIRELAITTIGRLTIRNPAYVMPSLRKTLIQLLTELGTQTPPPNYFINFNHLSQIFTEKCKCFLIDKMQNSAATVGIRRRARGCWGTSSARLSVSSSPTSSPFSTPCSPSSRFGRPLRIPYIFFYFFSYIFLF